MKKSFFLFLTFLALTLILAVVVWVFFYVVQLPLTGRETAVVVFGCGVAVGVGMWICKQFGKIRMKNEPHS